MWGTEQDQIVTVVIISNECRRITTPDLSVDRPVDRPDNVREKPLCGSPVGFCRDTGAGGDPGTAARVRRLRAIGNPNSEIKHGVSDIARTTNHNQDTVPRFVTIERSQRHSIGFQAECCLDAGRVIGRATSDYQIRITLLNRVRDDSSSVTGGDDRFTGEFILFGHRLRPGRERLSQACERAVFTDCGVGVVNDSDQNELASVVSRREGSSKMDRGIVR